jgi:hypothetical protein
MAPLALASPTKSDLRNLKSSSEFSLREYMSLQHRRYATDEPGFEERLRLQAATALADLRALRKQVSTLVRAAESHRWRRWLVGGIM